MPASETNGVDGNSARVSLKVGWFLTDGEETGFNCVPGSHLPRADGSLVQGSEGAPAEDPAGAQFVRVRAGDAVRRQLVSPAVSELTRRALQVIFDRRIMHAAPNNHSEAKRVAWFIGYSCVFLCR